MTAMGILLATWIAAIPDGGGVAAELALVNEALVLERAGNDPAALAWLDAKSRSDPSWALPRIEAGRIRLKSAQDLDRAELDLEAAMSLAPENPRVHYLLGLLMQERGVVPSARRFFEQALALRPEYEEANDRLGAIYFAAREYAAAEQCYRRWLKAQPDALGASYQLAATLDSEGKRSEAVAELQGVMARSPNPIAARRLADLYERNGQADAARRLRAAWDAPPRRSLRTLKKSRR
jgi:tetratricopeptide (TPR) repeat protein